MYGTVKAALSRLTQSFAAELYADGIAVNAAAPSKPVATEGAGTLDLAKDGHRGHQPHHRDRVPPLHR